MLMKALCAGLILALVVNVYLLLTMPRRIAALVLAKDAGATRKAAQELVEPLLDGLRTISGELTEMVRGELRRAEQRRFEEPESPPGGEPESSSKAAEEEDEPTEEEETRVIQAPKPEEMRP